MSITIFPQQHLEAIFHLYQFFIISISYLSLSFFKKNKYIYCSCFKITLKIISKAVECINVLIGNGQHRC